MGDTEAIQSKIVFLGTGAGGVVAAKQLRATAGILISVAGNNILIDPGPGCLLKAQQYGVNLRDITAILVSHAHLTHCNDINIVIDAMTYAGADKQGVLIANSTLINGTETQKPYLTEQHKKLVEKFMVISEGQRVGINDLEILAVKTEHDDKNAVGFKLYSPHFVLTYSGDTEYFNELTELYKGTDILILNVKSPSNIKDGKNLNSEDAVKILKKITPKLTIITHFGEKMLKADPINEAREIQKQTGCQVISAKDGLVMTPMSYDAVSRQKILLGF